MAKKKPDPKPEVNTTTAAAPVSKSAKDAEFNERNAIGSLVTIVLDLVKEIPRSWPELSEEQQDKYLNRVHRECQHAVRKMAQVIATKGCVYISCEIDSVQFKDGGKVTLKFPGKADGRHELADRSGGYCTLVIQDWDFLNNIEGMPTSDPDQAALDLEAAEDATSDAIVKAIEDSSDDKPE